MTLFLLTLVGPGNMGQLHSYDNWTFMRHTLDTYGSICRLHTFLGVRPTRCVTSTITMDSSDAIDKISPCIRSQGSSRHICKRPGYFLQGRDDTCVSRTSDQSYVVCMVDRARNRSTLLMLGPGLLSTDGPAHRKQRKMLNPVFSAAHMRGLIPFFYEIAGKVSDNCELYRLYRRLIIVLL